MSASASTRYMPGRFSVSKTALDHRRKRSGICGIVYGTGNCVKHASSTKYYPVQENRQNINDPGRHELQTAWEEQQSGIKYNHNGSRYNAVARQVRSSYEI